MDILLNPLFLCVWIVWIDRDLNLQGDTGI